LPVDNLLKELIVRSRWRILLCRHICMTMRKKLVQTDTNAEYIDDNLRVTWKVYQNIWECNSNIRKQYSIEIK
jgi:uncharacterized protein YxjI